MIELVEIFPTVSDSSKPDVIVSIYKRFIVVHGVTLTSSYEPSWTIFGKRLNDSWVRFGGGGPRGGDGERGGGGDTPLIKITKK